MTIPEVRKFHTDDYLNIKRIEGSSFGGMSWELEGLLHTVGPSFTGKIDGEIMFCVGVDEMWDGVGSVWLVLSDTAKHHPGVFYAIQVLLGSVFKNYHRLQAVVRKDWPEARRFAEWYGFKREGTMRKYGPHKEDYHIYARVK